MPDKVTLELKEYLGKDFARLPNSAKEKLKSEYTKNRKSESIYFWWFLSLHYAYVHKWLLCLVFIATLSGFVIWWVIDLFRLRTILKEYNENLAKNLLAKVKENDRDS